jgi:hypothetical protein
MRIFLYTYKSKGNFELSIKAGVFGAWKDRTGLATKIQKLKRGDLIIIRNAASKINLEIFGCGRVVGDVYDQEHFSPYRDLLWNDEINAGKTLYPMRVPVDFKEVPTFINKIIPWKDLDKLKFKNKQGFELIGKQSWAKKFAGNFLEQGQETEHFLGLIGLKKG